MTRITKQARIKLHDSDGVEFTASLTRHESGITQISVYPTTSTTSYNGIHDGDPAKRPDYDYPERIPQSIRDTIHRIISF